MIKKLITLCAFVVAITFANSAKAQLIFKVDSKYDADVKVFVASSKYDADLIVYEVSSKYDAQWRNTDKKSKMNK